MPCALWWVKLTYVQYFSKCVVGWGYPLILVGPLFNGLSIGDYPNFSFLFYIDGHVVLVIHPCLSIFYNHRPFMGWGVTHPFLSFSHPWTCFYWGQPLFPIYIHGHVFWELTILSLSLHPHSWLLGVDHPFLNEF